MTSLLEPSANHKSMGSSRRSGRNETHAAVLDDNAIRVRFDYTSTDMQFDRANVYLMDAMGHQISLLNTGINFLMTDTRDQFFVDIPMENIRKVFPDGVFHGHLTVKLALMNQTADKNGMPGSILTEAFELDLKGNLTFNAQDVMGDAAWNALTVPQQEAAQSSLNFGRVGNEHNRDLLGWLVRNFMDNASQEAHKMTFDTNTGLWIGTAYQPVNADDDSGQCKFWVQMQVVQNALGITLPPNVSKSNAYTWLSSETVEAKASWENGSIQNVIEDQTTHIQAGDMLQMTSSDGTHSLHTVIIGKTDQDGIWVFDSNYGLDKTPRYHKMFFDSLNGYDRFTVYRVK